MHFKMSSLVPIYVISVAFLICVWLNHTVAATLDGHAFVAGYATGSCWGDPSHPECPPQFNARLYSSTIAGDTISTDLLEGIGTLNGVQSLSAIASVTPNFSSLLHVSAAAASTGGNGWIRGTSAAYASWRDVIVVSGGELPSHIRINFAIGGELFAATTVQEIPWTFGYAAVGARVGPASIWDIGPETPPDGIGQIYARPMVEYASNSYNAPVVSFAGFDNATFDPFYGIVSPCAFHYDATFNPSLGGYDFFIGIEALASGNWGFGDSKFVHSLGLNAVTFTDGTPLADAGLAFTFDSGLSPGLPGDSEIGVRTIPEPSSMMLTLVALSGGSVFFGLRRTT